MYKNSVRYISEDEYEEYLFLRFYTQSWRVKKLLRRRDKIRKYLSSKKNTAREECIIALDNLKPKLKKEIKEMYIRKAQFLSLNA